MILPFILTVQLYSDSLSYDTAEVASVGIKNVQYWIEYVDNHVFILFSYKGDCVYIIFKSWYIYIYIYISELFACLFLVLPPNTIAQIAFDAMNDCTDNLDYDDVCKRLYIPIGHRLACPLLI